MTESKTRSIQVTEVDESTREFVGLVAPYGETIEYDGSKERYEPGVFTDAPLAQIYWNHDRSDIGGNTPIGRVSAYRETEAGLEVVGKIARTARGDEVYTLLTEGVLNALSANFYPTQTRIEDDVTVWERAELVEVSVVGRPAYPSAKISEVRSEEATNKKEAVSQDTPKENMTEIIDTEARSGLENLERRLEVGLEGLSNNAAPAEPQFRSGGEFLKALATGSEEARKEAGRQVRASYTGVVANAHAYADWKNDLLVIVDRGRPVINAFDKQPLGPSGMSVEYPKIASITGDVAVQANEADNLVTIKVATTTASAPIVTYGVYSELSRQAIERTDIAYLDVTLRAQAASYAKVTNGAVRTALTAATPQTSGIASFALTAATAQSFISVVSDAVQKIDANAYYGQSADFALVSWDVYQKMVTLVDSAGRPIFDLNNDGSNTVGNVNVAGARATVAGLPVLVDSGLAAKTFYVANSHAVTTWENAGAPLRLEDENIVNLTKQFSLYGYMAAGVKDANGLVKATIS